MSDGDGAAGRGGGPGRGPFQERGGPHLRGVAPLGDHAGAALSGRGRGRAAAPVTAAARAARTGPPPSVEDEIVEIRKDLAKAGHEAGAATIAFHLERRHGTTPAVSTIWRILTARGFVTPQPHKRPKSSYVRFAAEQPNERWQTDITHWPLADGTDVEILNIIDDHSRLCIASTARRVFKAADVDRRFRHAAATYGDPASVLSDNGAVFTGRYRRHGRVALEVTLTPRGIRFTHSRPYHPQTCGKVERFHQTLRTLARHPAPRPHPSPACKPSSTPSAATTTPSDPTGPSAGAPPSRPTTPAPKPSPPASRSTTPAGASATTPSTPTASSPCATTAASTTSASAAATPANPCSSSSRTSTSGSPPPDGELLRDFQLDPTRDYQPQPKT